MAKESREEYSAIQQLQITEQALQNLVLQKQMFQLELIESNNALDELKIMKTDEVFKIIGNVMFKTDKEELKKELQKKIDLLNLRLKAIENQEEELRKGLLKARSEILKKSKVAEK